MKPSIIVSFAFVFAVFVVHLGVAGAAEPETGPASLPGAALVTPLMKGEMAPFDGLLVPEARFVEFLRQRIDLETCTMRVAARDKALAAMPAAPPAEAPRPAVSGGFLAGVAVGAVGGIVLGVVVVYAATKVLAAGN